MLHLNLIVKKIKEVKLKLMKSVMNVKLNEPDSGKLLEVQLSGKLVKEDESGSKEHNRCIKQDKI